MCILYQFNVDLLSVDDVRFITHYFQYNLVEMTSVNNLDAGASNLFTSGRNFNERISKK